MKTQNRFLGSAACLGYWPGALRIIHCVGRAKQSARSTCPRYFWLDLTRPDDWSWQVAWEVLRSMDYLVAAARSKYLEGLLIELRGGLRGGCCV